MSADLPKLGPRTWDILVELAEPASAGDLARRISLSESGVLVHLRRLRDLGYVTATGVGEARTWSRTDAVSREVLAHAEAKRVTGALKVSTPEESRAQAARGEIKVVHCSWCGERHVPVDRQALLAPHLAPGTGAPCAGGGRFFREAPAAGDTPLATPVPPAVRAELTPDHGVSPPAQPSPAQPSPAQPSPAQTGSPGAAGWVGLAVLVGLVLLLVSQCGGGGDDESVFGPDDKTSDYCLSLRLVILDNEADEDDRIDAIVDYKRACK